MLQFLSTYFRHCFFALLMIIVVCSGHAQDELESIDTLRWRLDNDTAVGVLKTRPLSPGITVLSLGNVLDLSAEYESLWQRNTSLSAGYRLLLINQATADDPQEAVRNSMQQFRIGIKGYIGRTAFRGRHLSGVYLGVFGGVNHLIQDQSLGLAFGPHIGYQLALKSFTFDVNGRLGFRRDAFENFGRYFFPSFSLGYTLFRHSRPMDITQ